MRLINADELIKIALKNEDHTVDGYDIMDAPTIDAKPVVHGRWIKMTGMMPPEYHGHYECSACQWHMKGIRNSWTREEELLYCPNCGAKMDDEWRSEDADTP